MHCVCGRVQWDACCHTFQWNEVGGPLMVPGLVTCFICIIALIKRCPLAQCPRVFTLLEDFFFFFFSNMHSSPVTTIANTLSTWVWAWVKSQAWQSTNGILPWVFKRPFIFINGKTQKDYIMDWVCAIRVCMCVCRCTLPRAFACA